VLYAALDLDAIQTATTKGKLPADSAIHVFDSSGKGAVTNREGTWQGLAEIEQEEGFSRFRATLARAVMHQLRRA